MKKAKKVILSILLSAVLLCGAAAFTACGEPEVPATVPGENTIVDDAKGSPAESDAKYVAYAVAGKLRKASTFTASVTGKTVAQKGFITYEQTIDNALIKHGDEFYSCSQSSSLFVNMKHEAFVKNGKVAYRNNGETIKLATEADYAKVYGVVPGDGIDGHILNDDTIVYSKYVGESDGLYTFEYGVHQTEGSAAMRKQMKEFGGLSDLPEFKDSSHLTLTVKKDWTPVSLVSEEQYSISVAVLGAMDCKQTLTCTFDDFGAETAVPDTEAFNAAMDSTPSVVTPGQETSDPALEGLIGALVESDLAGGVALRGTLDAFGFALPLDIGASVDIDKMADGDLGSALKLSAAFRIANFDARLWFVDNDLYINAAGRKYVAALPTFAMTDGGALGAAVKITETDDGYRLSLTQAAKLALGKVFKDAGLTDDLTSADFRIDFYAPGDRIGTVTATLVCGASTATADLTLAERKFIEPQDKDSYQHEISQNISVAIRLPLAMNLDIPVDIDFHYDLADPDPLSALRASIRIRAAEATQENGYELKNLLALTAMFAPSLGLELPPVVGYMGQADVIELAYIGDGNFYLVLQKYVTEPATEEGAPANKSLKVFYVQALPLGSLGGLLGGVATAAEGAASPTLPLSLLANIAISTDANGIYAEPAGDALAYAQTLFAEVNDTLIAAMGESGATFSALLGLGKTLEGVRFAVTKDADGYMDSFALTLRVYKDAIDPDKPLAEQAVVDFLQLTIDFNGPLTAPIASEHIGAALTSYAEAKVMIDRIDALSASVDTLIAAEAPTADEITAMLTDIDAAEAAYNALVPDVQIMVLNAKISNGFGSVSVFKSLRDKVNKLSK